MRRNQVVKETMVLLRSQIASGVPISEKILAAANAAISAGSVAEARLASEIIAGAVSPAVPAVPGGKEPAPRPRGNPGHAQPGGVDARSHPPRHLRARRSPRAERRAPRGRPGPSRRGILERRRRRC